MTPDEYEKLSPEEKEHFAVSGAKAVSRIKSLPSPPMTCNLDANAPISFWRHISRPESHTLDLLWSGLCHLYRIVKDLEHARIEQDPKAKDMMLTSFDCDGGSGDSMLLNYFFWYAGSADSFLDLFSTAFDVEKDADAKFTAVRKFRDKVAGHLSHVQPGKGKRKDNRPTQSASLRQYITWHFGRYSVGREITGDVESGESSPADWGWELTAVHEELDAYIRQKLAKNT